MCICHRLVCALSIYEVELGCVLLDKLIHKPFMRQMCMYVFYIHMYAVYVYGYIYIYTFI